MRQVQMLAALILTAICWFSPVIAHERTRIVNGTAAVAGEFPYVVSLRIWGPALTEIHWCGGSIISPTFILTAGHCLDEQLIFARVGRLDLDDFSDDHSHSYGIRKVYLYPDYSVPQLNSVNDLAIAELVEAISFSNTVAPVRLPDLNSVIPFGQAAYIAGWGMMNESVQEPAAQLQKASVTLFADSYCQAQLLSDYLPAENFCAGDVLNTRGHCTGDSGGPLVVDGVQWGIVSWSLKPCVSAPGVYTRLANSDYRKWILEVTGV